MDYRQEISKNIYFIFCQKGEENQTFKFEENENVKNIKLIKEEKNLKYSYKLYSLSASIVQEDPNISLFLTNSEDKYLSKIKCFYSYSQIFLYKVNFKPFSQIINSNLNQIILPYKDQFIAFKKYVVGKNNDLFRYLIFSSLDFIQNCSLINFKEDLQSQIHFEFDYFLYVFISCLFLNKNNPKETLVYLFFKEFNTDLIDIEKSFKNDSNKVFIEEIIDNPTLDLLLDYDKINNDINSMIEKDESINCKLDLLLAYYYINYKPKIFINFISNKNKRKDKLLVNLNKNRKIFKNFTTEIMDFDIFCEAENLIEIQYLFELFPNLPELVKALSTKAIFYKFEYFSRNEKKICNVAKIIKPKKEDNIQYLKKNIEKLIELTKEANIIIFILSNEFFISYCEYFYQENLKNLEMIIDIFQLYRSIVLPKEEEIKEEIYSYYYETGIHLIKCGKIINNDILLFVKKVKQLKYNVVIPEEVYKSIGMSDDISFINNLLNDDLNLGDENINFIKAFFNNFKNIKELINIVKWDKDCCKNDEIFFICFDTLKNLWVREKDIKLPKTLCIFISELFIILSKKREIFLLELTELISNINNKELIINIFILILNNKAQKSDLFLEYIDNFINLNIKEGEPLSVYYKLYTINPNERINFLIQNLKVDYAIKVEDFINFPNKIEDRITLYTNLYQEKYFFYDDYAIEKLEYFQESIKAKDKINTLKYKDAINVFNNISRFQNFFLFFLPKRINEDDDYLIDILLIEFSENIIRCKEQYNSLKLVLNYWKHFFNFIKKIEINELVKFLNMLENTPIIEFNKYEINIDSFLFYINEAKQNDKLFNSFFFMGLYKDNSINFQENEEEEKFNYTLMRFNELKSLGINSNLDILPCDLVNKLTELVYKNNDRLDDELSFIKEYFEFDKNSNFFDINKIKREFINNVNNYKKINNLGDYEIEFNDDFILIKLNDNENYISSESNKNNIIQGTKDEDDDDDDGFNLLNDDDDLDIKKENSKKSANNDNIIITCKQEVNKNLLTEEQKNQLLKEMIQMSYDFYYIYRINNFYGDDAYEGNLIFFEKFTNFYWENFKNIHKYDVLSEKQFYEDVLILMTRIFLSAVGINFFKKDNNNKEIFLIYEFYEILEIYKKYHLILKSQLSKIIEIILESKENNNDDIINTENIELLFREIDENLKGKNLFNLPIKLLLINEKIKNDEQYNFKIIDFIIRDDNKHLLNDAMPLLDNIFKDDIKSKLNFDDEENQNDSIFTNYSLNQLDKKCKDSKDLIELLLFYFESKITKILFNKKNNLNERDIYQNKSIKNYLRQCLNILEKESRKDFKQENKNISILFCIAFTKCFLSNYIKFLHKKNQELGDANEINDNIIPGHGNNSFRTTLKLYILKLFYNIIGNYYDFIQFNFDNYQIKYFQNEDIKKIKGEEENLSLNNKQKKYGFDYLLITMNENEIQEYINIENNLNDLCINKNNSNTLVSTVNSSKNLDNFICAIINIFLSNYQNKNYFNSDEFKAISKYMADNLEYNNFYKINDIAKSILLLFIDHNKYKNKILKIEENMTYGSLSYNQLLAILFSLRYALNTLLYSNKKKLFYQLIANSQEVLKNNYFSYYNKDLKTYNNREINHLTFSIIRFIILGHLYFSFLLNNIYFSDINYVFINNDNDLRLIELLVQEFELIKTIIELKGIRNIIVFMNYVFDDIKSIIIDIECENNKVEVIENNLESVISKYLENFENFMENYNNLIKNIYIKEEKNEFKNIILENKMFYNKNDVDKKYPFISYLTITNFSSINDFKNQFLYLINDKQNYPMINCILNNLEIITIINNFPFINSFINEIYNELVLKIKKEDLNKAINDILPENITNQIESFNNKIKEINKLKSFSTNTINEISINSKVSEIINIKDNSIFKLFENIIKIYNEFLMNTKIYKDNKNFIEPIIIQNASSNDYINFSNNNDNNNYNNIIFISPNEKLEEIISLYSKRNRFNNKALNLYNGSKINYDFNQIEMLLQKEYLYGKKPFQENQRTFIFSNEVFSEERNNLIENLNNKYPQMDIVDEMLKNNLDNFLNDENKTKDIFVQIYINLQYILIYLMIFDKNNYDCKKNISLEYIAKIVQKSNYQINELFMEFLNQNKEMIQLNNLLFLYEKLEIKCFEYHTESLSIDINDNYIEEENKLKISEYFKNNDILLKEQIILNSIKKYIMRYCIGNNQNEKEILKKIDLDKIVKKLDIWGNKIFNDDKFKEETKELMKIDNGKNILIKYFLNQLFKAKVEKREEEKDNIIIETKNEKKRRRKHIQY